jgi:c-di-GMP-binding flagellar brake protein YcgR
MAALINHCCGMEEYTPDELESLQRDRRRDKRFDEENKVVIECKNYVEPDQVNSVLAFTKDISIGGCRILTDIFFPVDSQMKITLTLSRSRQIVKLSAHVKWIKSVYDGDLFEMGVEFVHDTPQTIANLFKHLYGKGVPPNSV